MNAPFNLLRNVFEYIVTGWKQTLCTAFNDNSLRMDIFNGIIMKYKVSNHRILNILNRLVDNSKKIAK
jgi:hypothetical protein